MATKRSAGHAELFELPAHHSFFTAVSELEPDALAIPEKANAKAARDD
jgi:hypothetical protein